MKRTVLLTGVTGLVGSSLVVAFVRNGFDYRFVCLARGARGETAEQRVEKALRDECDFEGSPELYGKVADSVSVVDCDVMSIDVESLASDPRLKGVDYVLHCAADVNLGKDPTGRVFRVNCDGTKKVVDLARRLAVRELHFVATAYVAGKQNGVVYEEEQHPSAFNNPYEESKCKAEMLVRESGIPFSIYRPAIIVGRKSDGKIRKPLAFYRILEFLEKLKEKAAKRRGVAPSQWVDMDMNCYAEASRHIYFVPIDYVQKAISTLFPEKAEGKTYHVTGDSPVSADQILAAVCRVFRLDGVSISKERACKSAEERMFTKCVGDLFPYFSSDIVFDQTNIHAAVPSLANLEYGLRDLEVMVKAYLEEEFANIDWIGEMLDSEIDREPRMPGHAGLC